MSPPPLVGHGGESPAGEMARSIPTPFLTKTYQLVEDQSIDDIISWNEDGSSFIVWNPTEFARDLLPKYFKHNNFSSFVRQLNTYGFRKVVPDRWEFSNDCFRKGEKSLLRDIQRRKVLTPIATPCAAAAAAATVAVVPTQPPRALSTSDSCEEQVVSSNSSPGSTTELLGENERLRKENLQLNKELTQMKSLCGNIYSMMSNYADSSSSNGNNNQSAESISPTLQPLDLLPTNRTNDEPAICGGDGGNRAEPDDVQARLFGISLGMKKRVRESEALAAEHDQELRLQQPGMDVKSELLDQNEGENEGTPWLIQCSGRNQRVCN